ncbi:MAG TPA: isochorismatase family protein [Lacipirellulaceae bacterium]|nr:isochorismatase family protein [Lacipirellulaceae bacterium]
MPPEATALPRSPDLMRAADTALLVVDVQERLLGAISAGQRIAWNCGRLLEGARVLGVHAAATEQNPDKLGGTVAELSRAFATPARAKMAFSCGACGALFSDWRTRGIDRVLVCGIETHVCVAQTVLDLLSSGFQTYVAVDAVGARAALDHEVALRRLEASGATLTTVEAALFEWCERAGTDEFRAISALVKQVPLAE